jgi:hypothetical protein
LFLESKNKKADTLAESSSDSDMGLPPPPPPIKFRNVPNLAIKGLGLSTISNDQSGLTAE